MEQDVRSWIVENSNALWNVAKDLWNHPELSEKEDYSSHALATLLQQSGFSVKMGIAGLSTAFSASWGKSGIRIGLLAEYDALPGLSQQVTDHPVPLQGQACGHGCGHCLLGTAVVGAAISIKNWLEETHQESIITVFGCPSEEIMLGKIVMAKAGIFNNLDIVLSWHPGDYNMASESSYQAMSSLKYEFTGVASHASMAPEKGKSALDAVELMDVGANYYREHMPAGGQIHYTITNGGEKPNIVPDKGGVWYFARGKAKKDVDLIVKRLDDIANGAALMTGTTVKKTVITGCHETLIVPSLVNIIRKGMAENLQDLDWSPDDRTFAEKVLRNAGLPVPNPVLDQGLAELTGKAHPILGSSDLSDVSWLIPTGMFFAPCYPIGTPNHSWLVTACVGSDIGKKGMLYAAKSLASTVKLLIEDKQSIAIVRNDFENQIKEKENG